MQQKTFEFVLAATLLCFAELASHLPQFVEGCGHRRNRNENQNGAGNETREADNLAGVGDRNHNRNPFGPSSNSSGDNNNPILNGQRGGEGRGSGQLLPRFGQFGNSGNSGRIRQSRSASNSSESIASPRWNGTQTEIGRRNCSHRHHRGERRFGGDRFKHNRHNQTHSNRLNSSTKTTTTTSSA